MAAVTAWLPVINGHMVLNFAIYSINGGPQNGSNMVGSAMANLCDAAEVLTPGP